MPMSAAGPVIGARAAATCRPRTAMTVPRMTRVAICARGRTWRAGAPSVVDRDPASGPLMARPSTRAHRRRPTNVRALESARAHRPRCSATIPHQTPPAMVTSSPGARRYEGECVTDRSRDGSPTWTHDRAHIWLPLLRDLADDAPGTRWSSRGRRRRFERCRATSIRMRLGLIPRDRAAVPRLGGRQRSPGRRRVLP